MDILSTLALKTAHTFKTPSSGLQVARDVAFFYTGTPGYTGAIVIKLPASPSPTMVGMRLEGYEYAVGKGAWSVLVGGYIYSTNNTWLEYAAHALQPQVPLGFNVSGVPTVRLGALVADLTQRVVILGDIDSVWQYPGFRVAETQYTYSGWNQAWETGWTVTGAVTSLAAYTNIVSIPLQGAFPTAAPPAIGTGAVGTATTLARSDHTHTSPTGMLTTATAFVGDVTGTSGATTIAAGVIVNADINASAAIATSKIAGLDTALAGKVSKTGDTITGNLTLNGYLNTLSPILGVPNVELYDSTWSRGLITTSNTVELFSDKQTLITGTTLLSLASSGAAVTISGNPSVDIGSRLGLIASATGTAPLRIPHGAAPTSPVNGDLWTTSAGVYTRVNGVTVGPLIGSTDTVITNKVLKAGDTMTGSLGLAENTGIGWMASDRLIFAVAGELYVGNIAASAYRPLNVATPTTSNHAATKAYVDGLAGGGAEVFAQAAAPAPGSVDVVWVDIDDTSLGSDSSSPHTHAEYATSAYVDQVVTVDTVDPVGAPARDGLLWVVV